MGNVGSYQKKIGYMRLCTWNFFHVSCNVSYFAYVNLMEDFSWNSPSVIHSSVFMLSLNILVHGEFPSWPNSVVYGRISLCVLVLGRAKVVSSMLWMTKQGWIILGTHPHQLPPCPCVICQSELLLFFWIPCLIVDMWHNPRYFNHVVSSFKKNAMWLLLVGHVVSHAKIYCL